MPSINERKENMTDNEKRAHDLAIVMLPKLVESRLLAATQQGVDSRVDWYAEYITLYERALTAFNRDNPIKK